jgi:hypothetical protein
MDHKSKFPPLDAFSFDMEWFQILSNIVEISAEHEQHILMMSNVH